MCISSVIQDKIDPASWIMRKQGWAGAFNPAAELERTGERALGVNFGKTETEKRMGSNRTEAAQRAIQPRHTGTPVHAVLNRASNVSIAGRRGPGRG